jgi:hypothetical protein
MLLSRSSSKGDIELSLVIAHSSLIICLGPLNIYLGNPLIIEFAPLGF